MRIFPVQFDGDVWIPVPVRFPDRHGSTPAVWADWVVTELTRGRPLGAEQAAELEPFARALAELDSAGVAARLWHYPIDGRPGGWVDVLAARVDGEPPAATLLQELDDAIVEPVTVELVIDPFRSAVRRLSLRAIGGVEGEEDAGVMASAEWIGVREGWMVALLSRDVDPASLSSRIDAIDEVLGGVEPWAHQDDAA